VQTRGLALGFPRSRNSEAHIYTKLISGFCKLGFHDVHKQEVFHLGFLGAKTPKPIYTLSSFLGFHKSGFCHVRRQEVSHLGFLGAETTKPIYTLSSFRGFASRDFAMCTDKKSRTWVSWESKL
jgi:hypothetical protein